VPESSNLHESYRQSLRELACIVFIWIALAVWNTVSGSLFAFTLPEPGAGISTTLGMPRWIFITVLLPWIVGNAVIVWFAVGFMKDSPSDSAAPATDEAADEF